MNQKKIINLARSLSQKGYVKLAQKVIDLTQSRQHKNRELLKEMKEEDKWLALQEQHRLDRPKLYSDQPSDPVSLREESDVPARRHDVTVLYPSFDDDGAPFFDEEEGIVETLSVATSELEELEAEQELGYLKILDIKKIYPKE